VPARGDASRSTCAVVVTFNRRALLEECLEALAGQSAPLGEVVVVDNASTDGTAEMVRARFPQVRLEALAENVGGAGGFHHGLELAHALGYEWLWLMDDDTIPSPTALEALLAGAERAPERPALLASQVRWTDGRLHPMNLPHPRWRSPKALVAGADRGLVLIRSNTFVSLLVARESVDRWGLPQAAYFIWIEDTEYTLRVLRRAPGYLVPESVVVHKTASPYTAVEDTSGRFYYHVRNSVLVLRGTSLAPVERLAFARQFAGSLRRYLARNGWAPAALGLVARGLGHGLRGPRR
jgi:rhamnopyranosyl-N-acetylglucosaminyl-diphospho-decaprenol beta-1,3/1,4-galactofuranosyltransferase